MRKRLFIAILLPEEAKEKLIKIQKRFKKLNVRWTKRENLHFTLIFIGWIDEEKVRIIENSIKNAIQSFSPFFLGLEKVVLGPDENRARMIWAVGKTPPELQKLKEKVADELKRNNINFEDSHSLKLHITLARAKGKELRGIKIDENLDLVFPVKEVCLMESELKKEGAEYKKLFVANFHKYDHKSHE